MPRIMLNPIARVIECATVGGSGKWHELGSLGHEAEVSRPAASEGVAAGVRGAPLNHDEIAGCCAR